MKTQRIKIKLSFAFWILIGLGQLFSQSPRISYTINSGWNFYKGRLDWPIDLENTTWQKVNLPHTWNDKDVFDKIKGYYRGESWYHKKITISENKRGKKAFLHFEGANQESEVYVNGQLAGNHLGGYTSFTIPIGKYLRYDTPNDILVKVTNRHNEDIPTLSADFTFFGGIYRNVSMVFTDPLHFSMKNGMSNLLIRTPNITQTQSDIEIKGHVSNQLAKSRKIQIVSIILNETMEEVARFTSDYKVNKGEELSFKQVIKDFKNPKLWSPGDPNLYTVECQIRDGKSGELLDENYTSFGFRWFDFDAEKGFSINGNPLKLIGVNRHQDYPGLGNALPAALHEKDIKLVKEMGANFLRIAHYPQDDAVMELCDRLGLITTVEIPIVNRITESKAFSDNSVQMMKEMILQDYNHPSIVIWAYMNEVLLRPKFKDEPERQEEYFQNIAVLAKRLENTARELDPSRYTLIPNHGAFDLYHRVGLTQIPMIVGWNLYQGWYGGNTGGFSGFLDLHRKELPDKPLIVTEYGAGADPRLRAEKPKRFDFSLEYQTYYHQEYMDAILERDFVAGVNVWNLADFSSEGRVDAVANINSKGILTHDRKPKDAYLYYQSLLSPEPYIAIASKSTFHRAGIETASGVCEQKIVVFTNQEKATLYHNSKSLGIKETSDNQLEWEVPFVHGDNLLEVKANGLDTVLIDYHMVDFELIPRDLNDNQTVFTSLKVNLGDQRFFHDDLTDEVWIPSQAYQDGSWGTIGGNAFRQNPSPRQPYGTDRSIMGTQNDPLYQTQQVGIEAFRADVPNGRYDITLHFAELVPQKIEEVLAYNLGDGNTVKSTASTRTFDVVINGEMICDGLNLADDFGRETAAAIHTTTIIQNREGLNILFRPIEGMPVLNAIEIKRK